jgi:hypothetical protein
VEARINRNMKLIVLFALVVAIQTNLGIGQTTLKYYGVDDIEPSQYSFLRDSLKGNFALVELPCDTLIWKNALTEAEKNNLQLVIWPQGHGQRYTPWAYNPSIWDWDLSEGLNVLNFAERYAISGGRALLAVLMSHEPFYAQGQTVFVSSQLKQLYAAMKKVAPHVKTFIYMNDMAYYDRTDRYRQMEDGIMDICGTFKHSFGTKHTEEETLKEIDDDYDLIQRKKLNMQLFFALQSFGYDTPDYTMPSAAEMQDLATKILDKRKLDGVFWYPWNRVSTGYTSWLSKNRYDSSGADRWNVVRQLSKYLTVTAAKENDLHPVSISLSQNYPNPFNPMTNFEFRIAHYEFVTLKILDVLGREVATLVNGGRPAGAYAFRWDASSLPSGVYFYQLRASNSAETKKLVLTK